MKTHRLKSAIIKIVRAENCANGLNENELDIKISFFLSESGLEKEGYLPDWLPTCFENICKQIEVKEYCKPFYTSPNRDVSNFLAELEYFFNWEVEENGESFDSYFRKIGMVLTIVREGDFYITKKI